MAFNKVGFDSLPLFDFDNKKNDASITGIYEGSRTIESIDSTMHTITRSSDTKKYDFWGAGSLNFKLKQAKRGDLIRVTYNGQVEATVEVPVKGKSGKTQKVKKMIHDYTVEIDDGK